MIRSTNRMRQQTLTTAATLALVLAVGACSNGGGGDDPSPVPTETSSSTPTETPTPQTDAEKATAGLQGYMALRDEAYRTGIIPAALPDVAGTEIHLALQKTMQFRIASKTKATADFGHSLSEPKKLSARSYEITDCEDWKAAKETQRGKPSTQYYSNQVELANPISVAYHVELIKNRWKVTSSSFGENVPC